MDPAARDNAARKIQFIARLYLIRQEQVRVRETERKRNAARFIESAWHRCMCRRRTKRILKYVMRTHHVHRIVLRFISCCQLKVLRRRKKRCDAAIQIQYFVRRELFGFPFETRHRPVLENDHVAFVQTLVRRALKSGKKVSSHLSADVVVRAILRIQAMFRGRKVRHMYRAAIRSRWAKKVQELDNQLSSYLRRKFYLDVGRITEVVSPPQILTRATLDMQHSRHEVSTAVDDASSTSDDSSLPANSQDAYIRPKCPSGLRNPCTYYCITKRRAMRDRELDSFTLRSQLAHCVTRKPWISTLHLDKIDLYNKNRLTPSSLRLLGSGCGSRIRTPSEKSEIPSVIRTHRKKAAKLR